MVGQARPVHEKGREWRPGNPAGHVVGVFLHGTENQLLGHRLQHAVAQPSRGTTHRRNTQAKRSGVAAGQAERQDAAGDDNRSSGHPIGQ
jgi:hypothetical protein